MEKDRLENLQQKMRNVPFGMSQYQIKQFGAEATPERYYRKCLLQISTKIRALKECEYRRSRIDIDIAEINEKLLTATGFDKSRLLIDLDEKEYNLETEKKLIEDAVIELAVYEKEIEGLDYTREEFEAAEHGYWRQRLLNDARREQLATHTVSVGTLESLEKTGLQFGHNDQGQLSYQEEIKNDLLPES